MAWSVGGISDWFLGVALFLMTLAAGLLILFNLRTLHHWSAPKPLPLWADLVAPLAIIGAVALAGARIPWAIWLVVLAFVASVLRVCLRSEASHWPGARALAGLADRLGRGLPWFGVAVGLCLGLDAGYLLATLTAQPAWSRLILPPFFLGYGLAAAAGILVLARPQRDAEAVRRTEVLYVGIALGLGAAYILGTPAFWGADLAWPGVVLWCLGLGAGLALPLALALGASAWHRLRPLADRATPWLILVGGLFVRQALWYAAQGHA
jgi:formate-dependent nitrite reductase membrane component NrfD